VSRIIPFDLNNASVGECIAPCDRGWMVDGVASTSGGGNTTIVVSRSVMQKGWFQPGRLVLVNHDKLPPWAGVVDTPIDMLPPAKVTLYNCGYLLKLRAPDAPQVLKGTVATIAGKMIEQANAQEEMYLRLGVAGGSTISLDYPMDQRTYWDQLTALVAKSGSEMIFRPKREPADGNRLYIYVDIMERVGIDTDFLLHDGANGNARVTAAIVDREIWNRVIGINGANAASERISTPPQIDAASIQAFRMRSAVEQIRTATTASALLAQTQQLVSDTSVPVLKFQLQVMDQGDTFRCMAEGNGVILHSSKVVLPDGRRGWRGTGRIMAMAYNEKQNSLGITLEAKYDL